MALDSPATLASVYTINKQAKHLAESATDNYRWGNKDVAKIKSDKKKALYRLKTAVLREMVEARAVDEVDRHAKGGNNFWCLHILDGEGNRWSFHLPEEDIDIPKDLLEKEASFVNYNPDAYDDYYDRTVKESLLHLRDVFGFNANDYLPQKYRSGGGGGSGSNFIGWEYLRKTTKATKQYQRA